MHSFIIGFGTEKTRRRTLNNLIARIRQEGKTSKDFLIYKDPDLIILEPEPTISINAVRDLKTKLKLKPYAKKSKIALVLSADLLTLQAQHALLKTLEEPMPRSFVILELNNPYHLLATIRSRCQIIRAPKTKEVYDKNDLKKAETIINTLKKSSPGKRIKCFEKLRQKTDAQNTLKLLLYFLRKKMRRDPTYLSAVKKTQEALENLESNVNPKLTLEHYALNFPSNANKANK
jgi:DNA polymerase III delta prime subunit